MERKPILHAIVWILIYIAVVMAGDALSGATKAPYLTGVLLLVLAAVLLLYVKKSRRMAYYGLRPVTRPDARRVLYYTPLIVLGLVQFLAGVPRTTTLEDVVVASLLMVGTGFVEEVVFRGFLFQGIRRRSGVVRAVLVSGITFGLGHIINLLRGFTSVAQAEQVATAIVIGIALAMLVAVTRSILPGILFHIVFNISGVLAAPDRVKDPPMFLTILAIAALYAVYLSRVIPREGKTSRAG